jgi:hypothetical protein
VLITIFSGIDVQSFSVLLKIWGKKCMGSSGGFGIGDFFAPVQFAARGAGINSGPLKTIADSATPFQTLGKSLGATADYAAGKTDFGGFVNNVSPAAGIFNQISKAPDSPTPIPAPGAAPTPQNSADALNTAAAAQRKAQGQKATIFGGANGGLLSSGSSSSQRLLLGT